MFFWLSALSWRGNGSSSESSIGADNEAKKARSRSGVLVQMLGLPLTLSCKCTDVRPNQALIQLHLRLRSLSPHRAGSRHPQEITCSHPWAVSHLAVSPGSSPTGSTWPSFSVPLCRSLRQTTPLGGLACFRLDPPHNTRPACMGLMAWPATSASYTATRHRTRSS